MLKKLSGFGAATLILALLGAPAWATNGTKTASSPAHTRPAPAPALTAEAPDPPDSLGSGILVDASSGQILWAKNEDAPRPLASLTKILTALVVLERADLDDLATITPEARAVSGASLYAETGMEFTVRDLLWGLLLSSGNDAATALAQKVSPDGTVAGFVRLMNQRAAEIGVKSSAFANPHGLDEPGHYTTARDLATITMTAMRNPTFAMMVATRAHDISWPKGGVHRLLNHNKMLWRFPGTIGVKTGYTKGAGQSLVTEVHRGNATLLAVVLDAGPEGPYADSARLYNWGFASLATLESQNLGRISPASPKAAPAPLRQPGRGTVRGLQVIELRPEGALSANRAPSPMPGVLPALAAVTVCLAAMVFARRRRRPDLEAPVTITAASRSYGLGEVPFE